MFVDTVHRFVKGKADPDQALRQIIGKGSETASQGLNELYQRAIELAIDKEELGVFRTVVGAIIAVTNHRPLSDATLAILLGCKPHVVTNIVNKLSSLLDRNGAGGGIRVRHLSITEFLTKESTGPDFRIDLQETNAKLGTACLTTMLKELKFNICQLETSSLFNREIKDLDSRIDRWISDGLQYSCVHWSNHVCSGSGLSSKVKRILVRLLGRVKVLHWIEVLSLLGKVPVALSSLEQLKGRLKVRKTTLI